MVGSLEEAFKSEITEDMFSMYWISGSSKLLNQKSELTGSKKK